MKKRLTIFLAALLLLAALAGCSVRPGAGGTEEETGLRVWFLDVGQADCAYMVLPPHSM